MHCPPCPAGEENAGWKFLYIFQIRDGKKAENMLMLCWLQVEGHIKEHKQKFTLSAVKDLTYEGFWRVKHKKEHQPCQEINQKTTNPIHRGLIILKENQTSHQEENSNSESDGSISSDGEQIIIINIILKY